MLYFIERNSAFITTFVILPIRWKTLLSIPWKIQVSISPSIGLVYIVAPLVVHNESITTGLKRAHIHSIAAGKQPVSMIKG